MNTTLELIGGGLGQPTVLTFEQLSQMTSVRLENVLMRKSYEDDEVNSWQGPALEPLLTAAQVKPGAMKVSLEAVDGYKVEARLEDLRDAIVALKDGEGRWLTDTDSGCALMFVPPHLPGNFWVTSIRRIRVEPVDESAP